MKTSVAMFISIVILLFSAHAQIKPEKIQKEKIAVQTIQSVDELNKILESSAGRLLMFDLYADWCAPCKMLSPVLETIAAEQSAKVTVYKINVDKNPDIAQALQVNGIPYVILVKNKTLVHAFTGLQTKDTYVRGINQFSEMDPDKASDIPNGKIVQGVREIRLTPAATPGNMYVYRGETVKLIIEKVTFPYSIHIPEYKLSETAVIGKDLIVSFKAEEIGIFPVFCNGKCPAGDGAQFGQIIVMQYKAPETASYSEVDAETAATLMKDSTLLILDVRTPNEHFSGHIKNSKLIPLQQLEERLSEIENYKGKPVLIYCRSGNRSTVAAEILHKNGFKKVYNLKKGIVGWEKAGKEVITK